MDNILLLDFKTSLKKLINKAEKNKALFTNEATITKIQNMYKQTKGHMTKSAEMEE